MVMAGSGHAEPQGHDVEKARAFRPCSRCIQIRSDVKHEFVNSCPKRLFRQDWRVGAPVVIGHMRAQMQALQTVEPVKVYLQTLGRASPGGVQNMGGQVTGHGENPLKRLRQALGPTLFMPGFTTRENRGHANKSFFEFLKVTRIDFFYKQMKS